MQERYTNWKSCQTDDLSLCIVLATVMRLSKVTRHMFEVTRSNIDTLAAKMAQLRRFL